MRFFEGAQVVVVGCGYVGDALARELTAEGANVVGLRRSPTSGLPYETRSVDLTAERPELPAADYVAYFIGPDDGSDDSYRRAYVDGLRAVIDAYRDRPPRKMIFASSTGVYGEGDGERVDETTEPRPARPSAKHLVEGEKLALSAPWKTTVLRYGGIYGPGRTRMIRQVMDGTAKRPPDVRYTNRIHRNDCAGAARFCLEHEATAPLYVAVDEDQAPLGEVLSFVASELGKPEPPVDEDAPPRPHKRCDGSLLRRDGFQLRYPTFREGYGALIAEERRR